LPPFLSPPGHSPAAKEEDMASKQTDRFPTLHPETRKTVDSGKVRLGDGLISDEFPILHRQAKKTADTGKVRLGDGLISDEFPV
jgi:hypothetical protein